MSRDSTVIRLRQPEAIDDPLSELAREGARRMLAQVLIAEADCFVAMWKDLKLPDGRDRVVRYGHGPHRAIQTGVGPVEVRRAKVRDRGDVGAEEKIRFSSSILPKWARRTKSLDALLPVLCLRGVSTGDFQEALAALGARTRRTCRQRWRASGAKIMKIEALSGLVVEFTRAGLLHPLRGQKAEESHRDHLLPAQCTASLHGDAKSFRIEQLQRPPSLKFAPNLPQTPAS